MLGNLLPVFYLNDDVTMRSILRGAYTGAPDAHAVYMKYPLTFLLSQCYKVLPSIPWMELFFLGCLAMCGWIIMYGWKKHPMLERIVFAMLVVTFCVSQCFYMHYTTIAAVLMGCSIWAYMSQQPAWHVIVCAVCAYMVRGQVFYMALPFLFIAVLWQGRLVLTTRMKQLVCIACLVFFCAICHEVAYGTQEWKTFEQYNAARTNLYDYTDFLSTDKYQEKPEHYGMTVVQSKILGSYNLMLGEDVEAQTLESVWQRVTEEMNVGREMGEYLRTCIRSYYNYVRYDNMWEHVVVFVLYTVLLGVVWKRKKWCKTALVFALAGGRSVIWVYLIWQGRFPERVRESLLIIEILLLLGSVLPEISTTRYGRVLHGIVLGALLLLGVDKISSTVNNVRAVNEHQMQWDALVDYCEEHADKTFLLDVFSVASYGGRLFEEDATNMLMLGGWTSGSPIAKEKLAKASKPCLLVRKDREYEWMEELWGDLYGEGEFSSTPIEIVAGDVVFCVVEYTETP